jgi:hypothetical protein
MLTALIVLLRSFRLICGGHRAIVLENLALRQQLAVLTRTVKRLQLRSRQTARIALMAALRPTLSPVNAERILIDVRGRDLAGRSIC